MYNKTRNRGLAFVTMGSPEEALAAVNNLESYVSTLTSSLSLIALVFIHLLFVIYITKEERLG